MQRIPGAHGLMDHPGRVCARGCCFGGGVLKVKYYTIDGLPAAIDDYKKSVSL